MVKLIAVGHWSSTTFGTRADGEVFEAEPGFATQLVERGYAREYAVKPHPIAPKKPSPESESTSSPAVQAAPKNKRLPRSRTKAK